MKTHWNKEPKQKLNPEYIEWLHNQPCYVCQQTPCEAHHVKRKGQITKDHNVLIPLCTKHHRGEFSPHGKHRKEFLDMYPIHAQIQIAHQLLETFEEIK